MNDGERLAELWLACAPSLSYRAKKKLIASFGSAENVLNDFSAKLQDIVGIKAYEELKKMKAADVHTLPDRLYAHDIRPLYDEDEDFPQSLITIPDPPDLLFVRGSMRGKEERSIAIVGSRRETRYGREQAFAIAKELAQNGVTVVSGLAYGIDRAAHEGALAGGGRTIAVLGSGLMRIYPKEHIPLAEKIVQAGGAVISELSPAAEPLSFHFPFRNRIVSGLCAGVMLVEAREKSGTLITVTHALEQSREVFCLPGPVDSPTSMVPHRLVREGARLATSAADILEDMGWEEKIEQTSFVPAKGEDLTSSQRKIYDALCDETRSYEELMALTGLSSQELNAQIPLLEVGGIVETLPGRNYRLQKQNSHT